MDRFVTRNPTWKTLNYTALAAKSLHQKSFATKKPPQYNKHPLAEVQLDEVACFNKIFDGSLPCSHKPSGDIFSSNSNDSGRSSSSSISPAQTDDNFSLNCIANKNQSPCKKKLGKLDDYMDCSVEKENDAYATIALTPKSLKKVMESGQQVQKTLEDKLPSNSQVKDPTHKPLPTAASMIMTRIQRDLNSPSAAARMKAIKAIKSPTKSAYNHFDIPEVEQSFHIAEPPSLQEIMRNIVVYVEVRSGEDNRSAGVRKVIEALGARVNLSLNRETTHVVFKDGLLSTFKKATQMNIPIVSILWIEACKNQRRICDPKDYPISNLHRYENPELYTKMKRVKSMQPDSESNKRVRCKAGGTPKDSTPTQKTGNLKKTSNFIDGTPTSSTNKKKTDISKFFEKIEKPSPSSASKRNGGVSGTPAIIPESPATILLNRINCETYTPLDELKTKTATKENNIQNYNTDIKEGSANATKFQVDAKKALNFLKSDHTRGAIVKANVRSNMTVGLKATITTSPQKKTRGRQRRHSLMADCEVEAATHYMNAMAISFPTSRESNNRRRSSIHTPKDMSVTSDTFNQVNGIQTIEEENHRMEKEQEKPQKPIKKRRTLYTAQTMDQTNLMDFETNNEIEKSDRKSTRRRTLYSHKTMETSDIKSTPRKESYNICTRRRTCFNLKSLEENEILEIPETNVANKLNNETLINDKDFPLTNEIEIRAPTIARATKQTNRRKTLYGDQTIGEPCVTASNGSCHNATVGNSLCLTPTNFKIGQVASSTLMNDSSNSNTFSATPTADATNGKLLEETGECTTPLIFSSIRRPGNKRRTIFDVSMDIITQRLQCINQSARRSLAPPTPSAEVVNTLEKHMDTPNSDITKSNYLSSTTTPKSSMETLNECTNSSDGLELTNNALKKKRKLFIPNEMLSTPPPSSPFKAINPSQEESEHLVTSLPQNSVSKRRRTLMPISQPQLTTVTFKSSATPPVVRKRRSTLDFEQIQNTKSKAITATTDKALTLSPTKKPTQQQIKASKPKPLVLVYTNMHQQQIDVIHEAIDKLGKFVVESCVTNATSHLVSLEPRRTLNLLRALARGLWILDYMWIVDSVKIGIWQPEECYELQDFSKAIEICRSERQAFANNYKCELFCKIGSFYVSSQCHLINKENMRELITLCGGHVVNSRQKARYIIGDAHGTLVDKLYLTPYWILDSITQMQLMKFHKYLYRSPDGSSSSQPLPLETKD